MTRLIWSAEEVAPKIFEKADEFKLSRGVKRGLAKVGAMRSCESDSLAPFSICAVTACAFDSDQQ